MPYALCPMPMSTSSFARKAILIIKPIFMTLFLLFFSGFYRFLLTYNYCTNPPSF
jgi:hypothetical protein